MRPLLVALVWQLGRTELLRLIPTWLASGQLTQEEGRQMREQLETLIPHQTVAVLAGNGSEPAKRRGRPPKSGGLMQTELLQEGEQSDGVDLGALAAGQ